MHLLTSSTVVVLWTLYSVNGFLTDNHQEGQDVRLACNRTQHPDQPVDWKYKQAQGISESDICLNGRVLPDFRHRFNLSDVDYTLTILSVTTNDTGAYRCIENNGLGDSHVVHLHVLLSPPGQLSLVKRTDTSLTIRFNQTVPVTSYNVLVNGNLTYDVTYSGIGLNVVTATVHNLIPATLHNVSVRSSRDGMYSKNWTSANYSTVPAAPGSLNLVSITDHCLTISWKQAGRVTGYTVMLDNRDASNVKYKGIGSENVTAELCGLSSFTKYEVNITAVTDGDQSEATSDSFRTGLSFIGAYVLGFVVFIGVIGGIIVIVWVVCYRHHVHGYRPPIAVVISVVLLTLAVLFTIVMTSIIAHDFFWHRLVFAGHVIWLIYVVPVVMVFGFLSAWTYYRWRRIEVLKPGDIGMAPTTTATGPLITSGNKCQQV